MDRKNSPRIGCVVMAAGTEQARLLRPYDGKALIARALAAEPRILVLHEPESNLDFRNQMVVLNVIERLTEQGLGAVINTHFPAHALEISTKTLVLMPDGTHRFGFTHDVLTEETLSESFGVGVKILPVTIPERPDYVCVAAFDAAPERKQ